MTEGQAGGPGVPRPAGQEADEALRQLAVTLDGLGELVGVSFGTAVVKVRPTALREAARRILAAGYEMLLDVGGVDYLGRRPPQERFEVVYHWLDLRRLRRVRVRVPVPEDRPEVPSLADLWPSANWAEREVYDLFGIRFTGHPDLRRILMPDDWQGHPLRKDYPLRGPERTPSAQALRSRFFPLRLSEHPEGARMAGGVSGGR